MTEAAASGDRGLPVVALSTDFGLAEPFVGLMHARVLRECPQARIIDLTHAIAPFSVAAARFWIERCYRHFPAGSIHVVVVDPGVGTARAVLVVRHAGQLFVAPDNGILAGLAASQGARARKLDPDLLARVGLDRPSATFHGRDLFAPLAGMLASGSVKFENVGSVVDTWSGGDELPPASGPGWISGRVILVDSFGNCFSNIDATLLPEARSLSIRFGDHTLPLVRTYGERAVGTPVALVNAFGVLEAACVQGRASDSLGLRPGSGVEVRWQAGSGAGAGDS